MSNIRCTSCPLRRLPVFRPNTPEEIRFIDTLKLDQMHVAEGNSIIGEGDERPKLLTLLRGWAFRYKTLSDGRRQILSFLMPGDLIGMQTQMAGMSPHGVEALTDVELCAFDRTRVWELYREHPELAFDVTWLTARGEAVVDDNLLSVGRRTALESVATLLVFLFRRGQALGLAHERTLELPLTQQHMADALGLSLVHVNKTLRRLQAAGLFRFERRRLVMLDLSSMQHLADFLENPSEPRPLI